MEDLPGTQGSSRRRGFRIADSFPQRLTACLQMAEVGPQIKFQLVIVGFHVLAELVERLVVVAFLEMCEFVYYHHAQELGWHFPENIGYENLAF